MGTGILNWVFALPAFFTIDKFGRRPLVIFTFPFLAIFHLWMGMSFFIDPPPAGSEISHSTARVGMIITGMYLFECFYSPGMGPVPFSYSAEAFPTHVRDVGMSWATATLWAFKAQGAFGWYAAWCLILWVLVILFLPETKGKSSNLFPGMANTQLKLTVFSQNSPWKNWIKSSQYLRGSTHPTRSRIRFGTSDVTSSARTLRHFRPSIKARKSSTRFDIFDEERQTEGPFFHGRKLHAITHQTPKYADYFNINYIPLLSTPLQSTRWPCPSQIASQCFNDCKLSKCSG